MTAHDLDVDTIASMYGCDVKSEYRTQFEHRVNIVKAWNIPPGSRVLEIGPGQGDCTIVLAAVVGERGHVDAVDPAPLDYGSPTTLGESQARLSASPLGHRINFIRASPSDYLSNLTNLDDPYTHVVLFHSLWYFASPSIFPTILRNLQAHVTSDATLCIAEYALQASSLNAVPHVLAALAQTMLEAGAIEESQRNVRTVVGPEWIKEETQKAGWVVRDEMVVIPPRKMADGRWEAESAVGNEFKKGLGEVAERDEQLGGVLKGMREAARMAIEIIGGSVRDVESMNVWSAKMQRRK